MDEERKVLKHFLAALAYRTQKALRGASAEFADFQAGMLKRIVRPPAGVQKAHSGELVKRYNR
jgi:hypothetical protein